MSVVTSLASPPSKRFPKLTVANSPVHGRGVFAKKAFRKGERIIEYTGRRILWSSVPDDLDDERTYYFGLDNNKEVIDPSVGGNEAQWINHSCKPNCEVREIRGRIFIHALRKIRPGEERDEERNRRGDAEPDHQRRAGPLVPAEGKAGPVSPHPPEEEQRDETE